MAHSPVREEPFPGIVSSVVAQEKRRRHLGPRVNVFIAGRFSFALSAELAFKHGLRPGFEIDAALLGQLLSEDGEAKALTTALNYLSFRPRSRAEVQNRLERDEWSPSVIEAVLSRLESQKLVDETQFAALWIESRSRSKPRGARLLKQELRQKGVERETVEAALPDAETELENAVVALEKLERKLAPFEGREREKKAIEMLARRGFGFGTVKAALRRIEERAEEDQL